MNKISAIIIAKNEEKMIEECLTSLDFCDEILVVDTGSTDKTVAIAKKKKAIVYTTDTKNFSEMRNLGLKKATNPWILYIDADERVSLELKNEIKRVVKESTENVAYKVKRKNFYLGNHEWPVIEKLERLFKKTALKEWYGELHESPKVNGPIGELDGFLLHYTHRNLTQMVEKTIIWSDIEANLRYKAGHPNMTWWRFPRVMGSAFVDSYIRQRGWQVGTAGLIESMYQSFSMFITYAKLWEKKQSKERGNEQL